MRVPDIAIFFVLLAALLVIVYPAAKICARLGYPTGLGILAIVPIANVLLLWFVALSPWPALRDQRGA